MKIHESTKAAQELQNRLQELLDSGELNNDQRISAEEALGYAVKAAGKIENIISPVFPYITCGEFLMHGGIIDIGVDEIRLGWGLEAPGVVSSHEKLYDSILAHITNYRRVGPMRALLLEVAANANTDELRFSYAIETGKDMRVEAPYNGISVYTPAGSKREHGAYYQGRAYFRNPDLRKIPEEVYRHKLTGYAFPYNLSDPEKYIPLIASSADDNGELADLRAFGPVFRDKIDGLVDLLKRKRWKKIYTQWGRHQLRGETYRTW